jgi:hypothetical protein
MEYLFIQRAGDREKIIELLQEFKQCSKEELVARYNTTVNIGIVGAHAQAQMIVALHQAFRAAFEKSPIRIVDNAIISLTGKIELIGEDWHYSINHKTE